MSSSKVLHTYWYKDGEFEEHLQQNQENTMMIKIIFIIFLYSHLAWGKDGKHEDASQQVQNVSNSGNQSSWSAKFNIITVWLESIILRIRFSMKYIYVKKIN